MASITAGLLAVMLSLPAGAEPGVPPGGDCALARDPLRCQALQTARAACKENRGGARQKCIQEQLMTADCAKDRSRCEARQLGREACTGKTGKAKQSCLKDLRLAGGGGVQVK